jgi:transcriptional regulator with XRE-family HTH domain
MSEVVALIVGPDEPDNVKFGEILHALRSRPRSVVAEELNVSSEYVRLIERGERSPALGTALKMLNLYSISYELDKFQLTFQYRKHYSVEFTSRIKEARYKFPELTRNELIGQVVRLLVVADDDTLKETHSKLLRSS